MSTDRGTDKDNVVHIHCGILFSQRKEWNNAICSNMDGPRDYHTKWSKSDRERQISHTAYMWNLKKKKSTNELIYKTERITDFENKLMVTKGETWEEKTNQDSGINKYTIYTLYTLYIKDIHYIHPIHKIINKDLLYTTGNPTQYSAITYMQKEPEKEQIYVYIYIEWIFLLYTWN